MWFLKCLSQLHLIECYVLKHLFKRCSGCDQCPILHLPLVNDFETSNKACLSSSRFSSFLISSAAVEFPAATMSTISPTDFDSVEIQQQYNDINNRWDIAAETEWDNENSSARLFERSRIKALAGQFHFLLGVCESRFVLCTILLPVCVDLCVFVSMLVLSAIFQQVALYDCVQ